MRKLARVTATVALLAAGFLATACHNTTQTVPKATPAPITAPKTADYNDGWTDGVRDLLDQVTNGACEANSIAYADVPACVKLYLRPATTHHQADGTVTSDPAGPALVAECLSQYRGVELHSCLTQPAN